MGITKVQLKWDLTGINKKTCFEQVKITTRKPRGKFLLTMPHKKHPSLKTEYVVNWTIVFRWENSILTVAVEIKAEDGSLMCTAPKPLRIALDEENSPYIALGTLSRQRPHERL